MSTPDNTKTIQLQRQGLSRSLRASFSPCSHGYKWSARIEEFSTFAYLLEVRYPSCQTCFGHSRSTTAWTNRRQYMDTRTINQAKAEVNDAISHLLGQPCVFAEHIEAYLCYTKQDLKLNPHIVDDVYLTCATYDEATDTVRHEPSGQILVGFSSGGWIDNNSRAQKYRTEIELAFRAYKSKVARIYSELDGPNYPKVYCAWQIGQYIKDLHKGEQPVTVPCVSRTAEGVGA